mgnify:CR=1 FL=1
MKQLPDITIWDNDSARIADIDVNLGNAMRRLGLKGLVRIMSEPPLLAREGLLNDVPVLEIQGRYWKIHPNRTITEEECLSLLRIIAG